MDKVKQSDAVAYGMLKLVLQYMELEKRIHTYGTDTPIYSSEIHIISAIARNPDIHIRGLAEQMGITSASVSEMISKLQKKGLVRKSADADNLSRLKLSLTTKGLLAHEEHMRYHEELNRIAAEVLADATDEQIVFLQSYIGQMSERLDSFRF